MSFLESFDRTGQAGDGKLHQFRVLLVAGRFVGVRTDPGSVLLFDTPFFASCVHPFNGDGNSGVFIWGTPIAAPGVPFLRGIEVQVLDHGYAEQYEKQTGKKPDWFTTHGDVFPIHGATMKPFGRHKGDRSFPSEERSKG